MDNILSGMAQNVIKEQSLEEKARIMNAYVEFQEGFAAMGELGEVFSQLLSALMPGFDFKSFSEKSDSLNETIKEMKHLAGELADEAKNGDITQENIIGHIKDSAAQLGLDEAQTEALVVEATKELQGKNLSEMNFEEFALELGNKPWAHKSGIESAEVTKAGVQLSHKADNEHVEYSAAIKVESLDDLPFKDDGLVVSQPRHDGEFDPMENVSRGDVEAFIKESGGAVSFQLVRDADTGVNIGAALLNKDGEGLHFDPTVEMTMNELDEASIARLKEAEPKALEVEMKPAVELSVENPAIKVDLMEPNMGANGPS